ncbi:MAG: Stp1/IreP family PP2C-type Ser/Thr phosphatase [Nitriliruptoraceae bacterium]
MRSVTAAGSTDVGQVREGNEDALLIRDGLFAVADGMGGHLAGEVASATALQLLEDSLAGRIFQDSESARAALRETVLEANRTVADLAEENPDYRGMGTTLTAAMVEGRRVHLAHVGDSRGYLLRDGQLQQLTDDHTLVQHLVDEGQITAAEAETHPQRSIITRAIGVGEDVEVDTFTLELRPGDQLLLCSDGLTGVVEDEDIAARLRSDQPAQAVVDGLIDLANAAGGPDNITVLLLRYEDPGDGDGEVQRTAPIPISSRSEPGDGDWAAGVSRYGSLTKDGRVLSETDGEDQRSVGAILGRATAIVVALAVLAGLIYGGGQFVLSREYFVATEGDEVVIYQGVDAELGPIDLARVVERPGLELDEVQEWYRPSLESGRPAADLADARRIVRGIPLREDAEDGDDPDSDEPDGDDADSDDPEDGIVG